jgi:hypothetical protein
MNVHQVSSFFSDIPDNLNFLILFTTDTVKLFTIREDYHHLMQNKNLKSGLIPFYAKLNTEFHVCHRAHLFFNANLCEAKNYYLCESNKSYHRVGKKYHMNDLGFDI